MVKFAIFTITLVWKKYEEGRKVGHLNLSHPAQSILIDNLQKLRYILPQDYQFGLDWALEKLK